MKEWWEIVRGIVSSVWGDSRLLYLVVVSKVPPFWLVNPTFYPNIPSATSKCLRNHSPFYSTCAFAITLFSTLPTTPLFFWSSSYISLSHSSHSLSSIQQCPPHLDLVDHMWWCHFVLLGLFCDIVDCFEVEVLHYIHQSFIGVSEVPVTKVWCREIRQWWILNRKECVFFRSGGSFLWLRIVFWTVLWWFFSFGF